jgi:hypothetical protein
MLEERLLMAPFTLAISAEAGEGPPAFENIVGVGIGEKITSGSVTGTPAVIVYVVEKMSPRSIAAEALVPDEIDGVATDVVAVGELHAQRNVGRARPAEGGNSVGHINVTAGTIGALVFRNDTPVLLSNNHVLADSNAASAGDAILQPGRADGGTPANDRIGRLLAFKRLNFAGQANAVDCAVASLDRAASLKATIRRIGPFTRRAQTASLGQVVIKSGRTTQLTEGIVRDLNFSGRISYGTHGTALFRNQIVVQGSTATPFSQGGDSGSLVLEKRMKRPIGLLFAGSNAITIVNPIGAVMRALRIKF